MDGSCDWKEEIACERGRQVKGPCQFEKASESKNPLRSPSWM